MVALVLVAVGLYGVLSYSVVQRTREMGIRLALGATQLRVMGLVLAQVGGTIAVGLIGGAAAAAVAIPFVTGVLFDVRVADVAAIPLALLLACVSSALVPAWRATRIDPRTALRHD